MRRTPIKQIAFDQGVAPSTVNDHIRAMKRKFGVETTADLVAAYWEEEHRHFTPSDEGETNWRIPDHNTRREVRPQGQTEASVLSDSMTFTIEAPWADKAEPRVVPEELDGPGAAIPRLLMIGKTVALILAAVVLSILAMQTVDGLIAQGTASG